MPRNGNDLRTIEIEGEPWFVAADVCICLDLKPHACNGSYTGHLARLGVDEKLVRAVNDAPTSPNGRGAGKRRQTLVSESGLYKLIMRSDKPAARDFQNWVTKRASRGGRLTLRKAVLVNKP